MKYVAFGVAHGVWHLVYGIWNVAFGVAHGVWVYGMCCVAFNVWRMVCGN